MAVTPPDIACSVHNPQVSCREKVPSDRPRPGVGWGGWGGAHRDPEGTELAQRRHTSTGTSTLAFLFRHTCHTEV